MAKRKNKNRNQRFQHTRGRTTQRPRRKTQTRLHSETSYSLPSQNYFYQTKTRVKLNPILPEPVQSPFRSQAFKNQIASFLKPLNQKELASVRECINRSKRREVLHALAIAGGRVSKPTFTQKSKIKC